MNQMQIKFDKWFGEQLVNQSWHGVTTKNMDINKIKISQLVQMQSAILE